MAKIDFYIHIYGTKDAVNVEELSSADVVERKHGMWVLYNKGFGFTHYCSNCNFEVKEQWIDLYNFCPNCGADTRKEADEEEM